MSAFTALDTYLAPIKEIFSLDGVSEISVNRPGEVWVERFGEMEYRAVPEFDIDHLRTLARLIAQSTEQEVSEEKPILSANLPAGFRVQVILPPAAESNTIAMSIRQQTILNFDLDKYEELGAFDNTVVGDYVDPLNVELRGLLDAGRIKEFIIKAMQGKKNMLISGGTSTGKTTFLNAALKAIPTTERLITCEDAREIVIDHIPNRVHLMASRGDQGRAKVSMQHLIESCLRLRPDRIIVGELRGAEAFSYLRAVNTGHPGSVSTLHADTPKLAIEQLILMLMQSGMGITRDQIKEYIDNVVHVIVQLKRGEKGRRYVSEVYFNDRSA